MADNETKAAWDSAEYNAARARKAHAALTALWQWVKNEHDHFEYAMPDDFICEQVIDALSEA